jgi:hypothetical protein
MQAKNHVRSVRGRESRSRSTQPAFETVRIASRLIAFYPSAIGRRQPYVLLLDPASGILKRLKLLPARNNLAPLSAGLETQHAAFSCVTH